MNRKKESRIYWVEFDGTRCDFNWDQTRMFIIKILD
jgi:hypothetical protein